MAVPIHPVAFRCRCAFLAVQCPCTARCGLVSIDYPLRVGVLVHSDMWLYGSCRNDVSGARSVGCFAWMWGLDVSSFTEVARRILDPESDDDVNVFDTKNIFWTVDE